jgi:hypothetical protein
MLKGCHPGAGRGLEKIYLGPGCRVLGVRCRVFGVPALAGFILSHVALDQEKNPPEDAVLKSKQKIRGTKLPSYA